MDIAVVVNCESREGYKYVVCFVDPAIKLSCVYAMKTRDKFIEKMRHLIDAYIPDLMEIVVHSMKCSRLFERNRGIWRVVPTPQGVRLTLV